ncbi:DUF2339 domain-containing protein [Cesiribacter sp. SM1]|uniref:DUF2339 domain-containing protein n=1 Tax=Cesiribacter sp. SM1 TaxID=2861196 RepID=UPI001CD71A54|nr:DUF2339 domain-containing protein [Cesiribacter sp. SM1]
MMEAFKKNWITWLGILFVFLAFLYFLKLAIDEAWVPPVARVAIGLVLGVSGAFAGYWLYRKEPSRKAEAIAGFGLSLLYATFAYASFSKDILWSPNTLFISIVATTLAISWVGMQYKMRILIFMCVLGGLLTPLIIQAPESQVWLLFFYVFALNAMAIYLSATQDWKELRIMSFAVTVVIYSLYYLYFDPMSWGEPFFYLTAFFVTYFAGLLLASWRRNKDFEGLNLYLSLLNAINFAFWSIFILEQFTLAYTGPALIIGLTFIAAGAFIYRLSASGQPTTHRMSVHQMVAPLLYAVLGVVVIAIAVNDLGHHYTVAGMHYVISTAIWLFLIVLFFAAGHLVKSRAAQQISMAAWGILMLYWFSHAWNVEWVSWFGLPFIPFLNPGALVWVALAASGFVMSRLLMRYAAQEQDAGGDAYFLEKTSMFLGVASHVVVGGLLTVQIQNIWQAYEVAFISLNLTLSIVWMVYALLLFLWGAFTKVMVFRLLGTAVLLATSIKIFFWDLSQASSIQKVVFLLVAGGLTLLIAWVNKRWGVSGYANENRLAAAEEVPAAVEEDKG